MGYIYGMGKLVAHCMCKSVAASIGIDLLWPMITNAYGVGEFSPRFVNTTLRKIIDGEPLRFTAATQNYDFVYVSDVAKAFYLVAKNGKPFREYMIGSGDAKPLKQFILEMVDSCGSRCIPHFGDVPFSGTNMPLSTFDISEIKADCVMSLKLVLLRVRKQQWIGLKHFDVIVELVMIQKFEFKELDMKGAYEITPFYATDERGGFIKDYNIDAFRQNGIDHELKEVFYTISKKGVIRAMHFQLVKQQAKLVRCISGHVYDVIIDLRLIRQHLVNGKVLI